MKKSFIVTLSVLLLSVIMSAQTPAKVRLPKLISDSMVLQRDVDLDIWGWSDPGTWITVRFNGGYYETKTGEDGRWTVTLPPQKAGGPYIMEVNEITIRDVLVGDVWLCSGQSNQETPIHRLVELFPEINRSDNNMIRHYKVPTQDSKEALQEEIAGNAVWHSGDASEVMNWTALAYFYAQEAYSQTGVPQGMLVSSLGGSAIESWVSQEHLKDFPALILDREALEGLEAAMADKGEGVWESPDFDDSDWKTMEMPGTWRENGLDVRGTVWMRKDFEIPESMDGRHAKLSMGTLMHNDRVYVNGIFVGSTGYEFPPRRYHIPAGVLRKGKNTIVVRLNAPGGNGEFIKDKPYKIIGDAAEIDLTGTWKYNVGTDMSEAAAFADRLKNRKNVGSGLYNGMIYPIRNYKVRAAIWYQGESNAGRAHEYGALMTSLITGWRELWNMPDMPFLLVQLPNYMQTHEQPTDSGWARIREAQLQAFKTIPNTALAVTYDVGEWNDIHPLNKKAVAQRLFLGARKAVYGEKVTASGPVYKDMKIDGDKIIITFTETGRGLMAKGGELKHFAIAGADRKFVWADAIIKGNKVIVSSKEVQNPVAVRYAWADNPDGANLCNKDGLLASPFRTDDW
ncbi:MAG: sialate O-acetylesterase [Bacteroidales bacterium]|nr:sialate O-acetylesterase [Bacteroidales bacterium]